MGGGVGGLLQSTEWNVKRGKLVMEYLCGTQRKPITAVHPVY